MPGELEPIPRNSPSIFPISMASTSWSGPGSIATVARGYAGAARAAGVPVRELVEPFARHFGPANYHLSLLRQSLSKYAVGGLVHSVGALGGRRDADIVTLHDTRPFWWNPLVWGFPRAVLAASCRRARAILTFNATMKREIGRFLGTEALRKTVAIPLPQAPPTPADRPEPALDLLWIGRAERRKHLLRFLDALADLPTSLRVGVLWSDAGRMTGEDPERIRAGLQAERSRGRLVREARTGIPSEELDELYRTSRCLVSTSDYEGFHAPPAEAYVRGVHLILPNLPVYRDLYGEAAGIEWYDGPNQLGPAILSACAAGRFRPDPEIVRSLSPGVVGRQLAQLYESVNPR